MAKRNPKESQKPKPDSGPDEKKIPEPPKNLRQREEWFRKRSAG